MDLVFRPVHIPVEDRPNEYDEPPWPAQENLNIPPPTMCCVTPVGSIHSTDEAHLINHFPSTVRFSPVVNCPLDLGKTGIVVRSHIRTSFCNSLQRGEPVKCSSIVRKMWLIVACVLHKRANSDLSAPRQLRFIFRAFQNRLKHVVLMTVHFCWSFYV